MSGYSRRLLLRERPKLYDPVDPHPVEAAVLDHRADTMRDMVRSQVASMTRAALDDNLPDEDFLVDAVDEEDQVVTAEMMAEAEALILHEHEAVLHELSTGPSVPHEEGRPGGQVVEEPPPDSVQPEPSETPSA